MEATTPAQGDDSRPPEVDGERPQLLLPETLDVAEHEPPPAVEPAKPELPTALTDSLPKTEIRAVQSAPIAGIGHISETQPQAAEPEIQGVSPPTGQGVEKLIKPAGIAAATFLAVATLGGLLWAFDKWKGRGTKKEGKKKAKKGGKKERRHVRQWTVYDE